MRFLAGLSVSLMFACPAFAETPEEVAAGALEDSPVWDGHNDMPLQIRGRYLNMLEHFDFHDTSDAAPGAFDGGPMQTDLTRLREGGVGAQFWSVYVSTELQGADAVQTGIEQIDITRRLIAAYPQDLALALTAADVEQAMKAGRIASLMGLEGGHMIGDSIAVLRQMYALGIRYMTLTHYRNTSFADSADAAPEHGGLTDFGKDLVREMNRLGMLVDLAHASDATMLDALAVTRAPLIFSHSNARAINGDSRNVPDNVLELVRENGGIVMAVAYPGFISEPLRQWYARREAEEASLQSLWQGQPERVASLLAAWEEANPAPAATIPELADHIDHLRAVAGIDHIGIGADYDGMPTGPVGMEDVSGYPALFTELARRGYTGAELGKIASGNMMRVLKEAEAYAAAHLGDRPIEYPVPE